MTTKYIEEDAENLNSGTLPTRMQSDCAVSLPVKRASPYDETLYSTHLHKRNENMHPLGN